MSRSILLLAAVATMALGACSESKVETAKSHGVSIDTDTGTTASATHITIDGDTDSDKLAVRLPGGIEAKVNLPGGMVNVGRFDIDGVGLYPGAKVHSVDVNAADAARTDSAVLKIGFAAPA